MLNQVIFQSTRNTQGSRKSMKQRQIDSEIEHVIKKGHR